MLGWPGESKHLSTSLLVFGWSGKSKQLSTSLLEFRWCGKSEGLSSSSLVLGWSGESKRLSTSLLVFRWCVESKGLSCFCPGVFGWPGKSESLYKGRENMLNTHNCLCPGVSDGLVGQKVLHKEEGHSCFFPGVLGGVVSWIVCLLFSPCFWWSAQKGVGT